MSVSVPPSSAALASLPERLSPGQRATHPAGSGPASSALRDGEFSLHPVPLAGHNAAPGQWPTGRAMRQKNYRRKVTVLPL